MAIYDEVYARKQLLKRESIRITVEIEDAHERGDIEAVNRGHERKMELLKEVIDVMRAGRRGRPLV